MMVTPLSVTYSSPGWVSMQLPPPRAAMSTMTEPCFIEATISGVMSFGLGLPGMAAVRMTMSTFRHCSS